MAFDSTILDETRTLMIRYFRRKRATRDFQRKRTNRDYSIKTGEAIFSTEPATSEFSTATCEWSISVETGKATNFDESLSRFRTGNLQKTYRRIDCQKE